MSDKEYWADGCHVNESGSLLKAGFIAEYLHDGGLINGETGSGTIFPAEGLK